MSKLSNAVNEAHKAEVLSKELKKDEIVKNYMGGASYTVDPLTRLKLISASSIFGEAKYYEDGATHRAYVEDAIEKARESAKKEVKNNKLYADMLNDDILGLYSLLGFEDSNKTNTESIMEQAIDEALDYDFGATLEWAANLRNDFFIRLNPQVIMVRASVHPKRAEWTEKNPGMFAVYNYKVMSRADDAMSQMAYYMYTHDNKKNNIPSVLKRSWATKLGALSRYEVAKYKNHEIGMINAVRISHAHSHHIDELMKTGTLEVAEEDETWERMKSAGKSWAEIFQNVKMGHMALLRNLRGFFTEVEDMDLTAKYLTQLKSGVLKGKQFPFRYYTAYTMIEQTDVNHKQMILDTLEECIDISIENMPKLKGRTMCLSDNSGSAWGGLTTEYGKTVVAEIDNLSSVITAMRSDEGFVGKFGDTLRVFPISKREGALKQARAISKNKYEDVGGSTEGGIWEFFRDAIGNKEHWDNIFIYSDQQAGTGGLYGTEKQCALYSKQGYGVDAGDKWREYINVYRLVRNYRKQVYQKVNVFSVQTAGYDNMVLPKQSYRISLMYGWTGKEAKFASEIIKIWDENDAKQNK